MSRKEYIIHIRCDYEAWKLWKKLLYDAKVYGMDANTLFKKMMDLYLRLKTPYLRSEADLL